MKPKLNRVTSTPVVFLMVTRISQEMKARAMPATARVMVCLPLAIPLGSPALVKILKPPVRIMIKATSPIKGIIAIRTLPK